MVGSNLGLGKDFFYLISGIIINSYSKAFNLFGGLLLVSEVSYKVIRIFSNN